MRKSGRKEYERVCGVGGKGMREGGGEEEGTVEGGKCERVRRCEECEEGERMRRGCEG